MTTQYKQITLKDGKQFLVHKNDPGISQDLIERGEREPETQAVLKQILKSGEKVLEIGANIGYYTVIESELVGPDGFIYAYEPVTSNVAILKKNLSLNNVRNVTIFPYAVGSTNTRAKFFEAKYSNSGTFVTGDVAPWYEAKRAEQTVKEYDVSMFSIDSEIKDMKLPKDISFLRMDVEGFEEDILMGMDMALSMMPNGSKLMFELHPVIYYDQYSTVSRIINYLWDHKFEVTWLDDIPWTKPQKAVLKEDVVYSRTYCPHLVMEKK